MSTGPRIPSAAALAVAVVAVSAGAILVRLSEASSSVAAFYRVLFTTLSLLPVALWRYRTEFARIGRRDLAFATLAVGTDRGSVFDLSLGTATASA